jgi:hypothetical protein
VGFPWELLLEQRWIVQKYVPIWENIRIRVFFVRVVVFLATSQTFAIRLTRFVFFNFKLIEIKFLKKKIRKPK